MTTVVIFEETTANGQAGQPEKITHVKRSNAQFFYYFSSDVKFHSIQATIKWYSNNIERSQDFYCSKQFDMATFLMAIVEETLTSNEYILIFLISILNIYIKFEYLCPNQHNFQRKTH